MIKPLYLEELEDLESPVMPDKERFTITDIHSLNWALRKMAAIKAKKADVNQLADAEIERIESYRKRELDSLQGSEDFFQSLIAEYAQLRREHDPKFKSEKTPYGSIGFRKSQPKWTYDDAKVVAYLKENELYDFVRVKEEPNKVEIKKVFKVMEDGRVIDPDGQEVEGITIDFLPDAVDVKVVDV